MPDYVVKMKCGSSVVTITVFAENPDKAEKQALAGRPSCKILEVSRDVGDRISNNGDRWFI